MSRAQTNDPRSRYTVHNKMDAVHLITGNMKQRVLPSRTQDKLVSTVSTVNGFYVASQRWLVFLPVPRYGEFSHFIIVNY